MNVTFWSLAGAMLVLAGFIIALMPRWWRRQLDGESTADWVRLRRRELEGAEGQLLDEVDLRALEDFDSASPDDRPVAGRSLPVLWLLPVVVLMSAAIYQALGGLEDVRITDRLTSLNPESETAVLALIDDIEQRVEARPDNIDYLSLLGQYYASNGDHEAAFKAYDRLAALMPQNAEVLGRAAQSEFLSGNRVLTSQAKARAEAALAIDPQQRAALGALGMGAFEAGDFPVAIGYWERMLAQEQPGTAAYQMMQGVIEQARARAQEAGYDMPASSPMTESGGSDALVRLEISAPAGADIAPGTTVFVLARPSGATSRMPTAVTRLGVSGWPMTVSLSDADAMAGQQLSALESVSVEVQVSPAGQPGLANATWFATADNVVPSASTVVSLELAPVTR